MLKTTQENVDIKNSKRKEVSSMEDNEMGPYVEDEYGEPRYGTEEGPRADGYFVFAMISGI